MSQRETKKARYEEVRAFYGGFQNKRSRIGETKHISTDADSSTNTTIGWIKNDQKPNFFLKRKKSSKTQKLKNV